MGGMGGGVQKSKPTKIPRASNKTPKTGPMPNFRAIKLCGGTTRPGNVATITNLQIGLNTPKSSYLHQATQKILAKIFLPQKIPKSKISNKNSYVRDYLTRNSTDK